MPPQLPAYRLLFRQSSRHICAPCLRRILRNSNVLRQHNTSTHVKASVGASWNNSTTLSTGYFFDNKLERSRASLQNLETSNASIQSINHDPSDIAAKPQPLQNFLDTPDAITLPHRRKRLKREEETTIVDDDTSQTIPTPTPSSPTTSQSKSLRQQIGLYITLSKPRLTFLMVLTTTTAYSLFPVAVSPFASSLTLSPITLLNLTIGTALSSASANAYNMYLEPAYDAKMSRTRTRPLVRGLLTPRAALIFATLAGITGVSLLYTGVNPTVAYLSASNIILYAAIYTPLKRISVINTWIGALVGSIPPLMGWAAAAGSSTTNSSPSASPSPATTSPTSLLLSPSSTGGYLLASLLFTWQFPHFNALSHTIRHEYARAGYKMLASTNPSANARIALRYALLSFPICVGLSYAGVTSWSFVATSGLLNCWLVREAWRFWREKGAGATARKLFWASNWYLAGVLVLAMVQKRGVWERVVLGGFEEGELSGVVEEDEEEEERERR